MLKLICSKLKFPPLLNCDVIRTPCACLEVAYVGGGIKIKINIRINRLTSEREFFLTL